jgi:DNA helicase-2/ATP-dependent DNA helicase PcrA
LLEGAEAVYDRAAKRIYYSSETHARQASFLVAHEFAHHWLDEIGGRCAGSDIDLATPGEPEMSWVGDPDTYSPKERAEALVNVYARELLLPRETLRDHCGSGSFDAEAIATTAGLPVELVMQQLADSLLVPEGADSVDEFAPEESPDETQRLAIECAHGTRRACVLAPRFSSVS